MLFLTHKKTKYVFKKSLSYNRYMLLRFHKAKLCGKTTVKNTRPSFWTLATIRTKMYCQG